MPGINRRSFLRFLAVATLVPGWCLAAKTKAKPGAKSSVPTGTRGTLVEGSRGRVSLIDLRTGKVGFIPADLQNGHSVEFQPHNPDRAVAIDLDHGKCAVVDLNRKRVVASIEPEPGYWLSGHGCFAPDGKRFYLAETPVGFEKEGRVNVFDTGTWQSVAKYPSGYAQTHMIMALQGGKQLAVGHYGTFPATENSVTHNGPLVYMDAGTGKITKKVAPSSEQFGMCHMDKTSADELVVSTRSFRWRKHSGARNRENHFPSPVVFVSTGGAAPAEMMPESLADDMRFNFTVKVHEPSDRVLVAHLLGNRISVWGLRDHQLKLVRELGTEQPLGIDHIPGTGHFLVSTTSGKGYVLEPKNFSTVHVYDFAKAGALAGAHFRISPKEFIT